MQSMALIHTVGELVPQFKALCAELLPNVRCFHILDEGLIRTLTPEGQTTPRTARRLGDLVARVEEDGAQLVLMTCSTVSPTVDLVSPLVSIPVLKIDEAMADLAVQKGQRIGVLATAKSALGPVSNLVLDRAEAKQQAVEVRSLLLDGAIQSLQAGDVATHDRRVIDGIKELGKWAEVVVLAQGSMARALDGWAEPNWPCPVLTNAHLGLNRAAQMLEDQ